MTLPSRAPAHSCDQRRIRTSMAADGASSGALWLGAPLTFGLQDLDHNQGRTLPRTAIYRARTRPS